MEAEKSANNQWVLAIEMDRGAISGTITLVAAKEDPEKISPFSIRIMYNALSQMYLLVGQVS